MALNKLATHQQLDRLWSRQDLPILEVSGNRFFLISDLHLGDGGPSDNCCFNRDAIQAALDHYLQRNFHLILLGDIEELWQFDIDGIRSVYDSTIYSGIRGFGDSRVHRIFGNHDRDWRPVPDPVRNSQVPGSTSVEAIRLRTPDGRLKFILLHGHQGDIDSDKNQWSSRFWVRVFKRVEPLALKLGIGRSGTAYKSQVVKDYEAIYYDWAKKNRAIVICGHTHRAIFASLSNIERKKSEIDRLQRQTGMAPDVKTRQDIQELKAKIKKDEKRGMDIISVEPAGVPKLPLYFNTGCGIYEDGLTGIEIGDGAVRLVKWDQEKYAAGPQVYQTMSLDEILKGSEG